MPRVKRGTKRRARRKKILERASGYYLTKSKLYRSAKESVVRGLKFAYAGRRQKKRQYRSLWISRIAAALTSALEQDARSVRNEQEWRAFRDHWMSRKSGISTQLNELLKAAPKEAKRDAGQRVNELKQRIEARAAEVEQHLYTIGAQS